MCMRDLEHFLFLAPSVEGEVVALDREEARHVASVLRGGPGSAIRVTDGRGNLCVAKIESIDARGCLAAVVERSQVPPPMPPLVLVVGMPEREAFERLIEGVVPLGVSEIKPVVSRYCQGKWWMGNWAKQGERLGRKAVACIKQAGSLWLPLVHPPVPFAEAVAELSGTCLLADGAGETVAELSGAVWGSGTITCLVGPPGGFSPEELAALKSGGALQVRLSTNRLRTELAATVLVAAVLQRARP